MRYTFGVRLPPHSVTLQGLERYAPSPLDAAMRFDIPPSGFFLLLVNRARKPTPTLDTYLREDELDIQRAGLHKIEGRMGDRYPRYP